MINKCDTCKHEKVLLFEKPCRDCVTVDFVDGIKPDVKCSNWEPKEPEIQTDRGILWKNSVPGSDIEPGKPSPCLVVSEPTKKPKKSKWRKVEDRMPKDVNRSYIWCGMTIRFLAIRNCTIILSSTA